MKRYEITESKAAFLDLSPADAENLRSLGSRLASNKGWWGSDEEVEKSVINCVQNVDRTWSVTVNNAIGIIAIGDVQITVSPKIHIRHFLYLAGKSKIFPRVDEQKILAAESKSLFEVVALWFIESAEKLLRGELIKGYSEISDVLDVVRGRIHILETTNAFYRGNKSVFCEFEDFNTNIAINRVIKAAAEIVAANPLFDIVLRRRSKAILSRMDDVSDLEQNDLRCHIDRLSFHYRDVLTFAKYLITCCGVDITHGLKYAWTFLLRTPDIVEAGVREVMNLELHGLWNIKKQGIQLKDSKLRLTPDLIFNDGLAVGDIKYKLVDKEWSRSDLYQIVTFVTGYKSQIGLVIGFTTNDLLIPPAVKVGDLSIKHFAWDSSDDIEPSVAGQNLAIALHDWLTAKSDSIDLAWAS